VDENQKPKPDDPEQSKRFVEIAIALGADKSDKRFKEVIESIAKPLPKTRDYKS